MQRPKTVRFFVYKDVNENAELTGSDVHQNKQVKGPDISSASNLSILNHSQKINPSDKISSKISFDDGMASMGGKCPKSNFAKNTALDLTNIDLTDHICYNEIKLNSLEQERIQSEALTWDTKHRNELRSRTLSNEITYRYVIADDGIAHVLGRYKAVNIHERGNIYDNKNRRGLNRVVESLWFGQRDNGSNINFVRNGREQAEIDRLDNSSVPSNRRSDGTIYTESRTVSDRRSEAGVQGSFLKIVHTFTDIAGKKEM